MNNINSRVTSFVSGTLSITPQTGPRRSTDADSPAQKKSDVLADIKRRERNLPPATRAENPDKLEKRSKKIINFGRALQKEINRVGDKHIAVKVVKARQEARTKYEKKSRLQKLISKEPGGRTAVYKNAVKPQTVVPNANADKYTLRWLGVRNDELPRVEKGINSGAKIEGVHSALGRTVLFGAQGTSKALHTVPAKIVLKEATVSGIASPLTAGTRIMTEVGQTLLREGAPKLAANIQGAPKMSKVREEIVGKKDQLKQTIGNLDKGKDNGGTVNTDTLRSHIREAKEAERKYVVRAASAKRQHYGKAWGAALNFVSGMVATPLTFTPAAPVGLGIAAGLALAQLPAGYRDEQNKQIYTSWINIKYADILKDSAKNKPIDEVTIDDIDSTKLHNLFEGKAEARLALTMVVYTHRLGELMGTKIAAEEKLSKLVWKPGDRPKQEVSKLLSKLNDIDAEIAGLQGQVDFLEFGDFKNLNPEQLIGKCLRNDQFIFKQAVIANTKKPGAFWSQALQRYVGHFHSLTGVGEAGIIHDTLQAIYGGDFLDPASVHFNEFFRNFDIGAAMTGGATAGLITGAVRDHKEVKDKKFLAGPRWFREKKLPDHKQALLNNTAQPSSAHATAAERPQSDTPKVTPAELKKLRKMQEMLDHLNTRWVIETPAGHKIDLRGTSACYKQMLPLWRRALRIIKAIPASLVSGPMGLVNTRRAKAERQKLKEQIDIAEKVLADIEARIKAEQPEATPSEKLHTQGKKVQIDEDEILSETEEVRSASESIHTAGSSTSAAGAGHIFNVQGHEYHEARIRHYGKHYQGYEIKLRSSEVIKAFTLPGDGYHEASTATYCGRHTMHMYNRGVNLNSPALFRKFLREDNKRDLRNAYPDWTEAEISAQADRLTAQGASLLQVGRFMNYCQRGAGVEPVYMGEGTFSNVEVSVAAGAFDARTAAHLSSADRVMLEYSYTNRNRQEVTHNIALVRAQNGGFCVMDSREPPGELQMLGPDLCAAVGQVLAERGAAHNTGNCNFRYIVDLEVAYSGDDKYGTANSIALTPGESPFDIGAPSDSASEIEAHYLEHVLQALEGKTVKSVSSRADSRRNSTQEQLMKRQSTHVVEPDSLGADEDINDQEDRMTVSDSGSIRSYVLDDQTKASVTDVLPMVEWSAG